MDNVDSGENLKQYVSDSVSDDKTDLKNFTASETTLNGITLAGSPAYKVIYSYTDGGENFKGLETGTIVGNKAYFIQYENSPSQFNSDLPTVQKMIDSFKLTRQQETWLIYPKVVIKEISYKTSTIRCVLRSVSI